MRHLRLPIAIAIALLTAPTAHAAWSPPTPLWPAGRSSSVQGLAVSSGDRPAVLLNTGNGRTLTLRRTAVRGGPIGRPITVATSRNIITAEGMFAGRGSDLVAGWLEIVNGSRRPVVATGPRLADRQVLAPGGRSTQILAIAANRRGHAVVAFWRNAAANQSSIFAAHRTRGRFGPAQLLATGSVGFPTAAIDERGNAVVAWTQGTGVAVAARRSGVAAFDPPVAIASPSRPSGDVGLAIDDGRAIVSWITTPRLGPNAVLVSERPSAAEAFAAPVRVSRPGIMAPRQAPAVSIAVGRALVAWRQRTNGVDRAAVAIAPRDGTWGAPIVARGEGGSVSRLGLLSSLGSRPPLLWMATDGRGLRTATVLDGGTLAPSRQVGVGRGGGAFPFLGQGASHSWLAANRKLDGRSGSRMQALLFAS